MSVTIDNIPPELLVATLGFFSERELAGFRPPDRRFYRIWISALNQWNKPGSPLYLGITLKKAKRGSLLKSNLFGGLLSRCLQTCQIPKVSLASEEEYEGIPHPKPERFHTSPLIQGITTTTNLPFFSVKIKDKTGETKFWTVYQQWRQREAYWNRGQENPQPQSDSNFLTDNDLVKLSRIILGADAEYSIDRYTGSSTDQVRLEMKDATSVRDEAC